MRYFRYILLLLMVQLVYSCISQFIPKTSEDKDLLVVEGLITDKAEVNTVKLSKSLPLGTKVTSNPVSGYLVTISDDLGNIYTLSETVPGTYVTSPWELRGVTGRSYTLHINPNSPNNDHYYESYPIEMKPVPPIDSVFYEKVIIEPATSNSAEKTGAQIYLNTHDPKNACRYYRWEFTETWEFILPYMVPNNICWISANSDVINIKNTTVIAEDKIERYPLNFISNETDRLRVKYSILVTQYSMNEDEYLYWEKLQNYSQQVGGLYDMIPSAVSSNVFCIDDPNQKVQGYFSVSSETSKRIFIKDHFVGLANPYSADKCVADTIFGGPLPDGLNESIWIIASQFMPPYVVTSYSKGCYDCTVRGTKTPPDFWNFDK
jgi:hypothetical protein